MKKALKIIFLDFTGTIDKPFMYREPLFPREERHEPNKLQEEALFETGFKHTVETVDPEQEELPLRRGDPGFVEPTFGEEVEGRQEQIEEERAGVAEGPVDDGTAESGYTYAPSFPGIPPRSVVKGYYDRLHGTAHEDEETVLYRGNRDRHNYGRRYDYGRHTEYGGGHTSYAGTNFSNHAYEECVKYLKMLADKTGAKIVYSTTYRHSGWKYCADFVGLPYEYSLGGPEGMGVTPSNVQEKKISWYKNIPFFNKKGEGGFRSYRQREIREWLKRWTGPKIENYVILDDEEITDPELSKHWVSSIKSSRFLKDQYEEALKILKNKA